MDNENCSSRNIPLPIQREVRQRCGFGCVICGMPLYEYEHMEEWAKVKRHVADEITLLCLQHHREKTNGLLPKEMVAEANEKPFNLHSPDPHPYSLHFYGSEMNVQIGSNTFSKSLAAGDEYTAMIAVMVDGIPLIGFIIQDKHILVTANLFDERNNPLLKIKNNQLIYSVDNAWDIQFVGRTLTIRQGPGQILLEIRLSPPDKIEILRGRLLCNGVEIKIVKSDVIINEKHHFSGSSFKAYSVAIGIGSRSHSLGPGAIALQCIRY